MNTIVQFNEILEEVDRFLETNGPNPSQYDAFTSLMMKIGELRRKGLFGKDDIIDLQKAFGEAMTTSKTLQGQVCIKPYGYPGDFEIIDKIYTYHTSPNPEFTKWDLYFQDQAAPKAVRNRKDFVKSFLSKKSGNSNVLSLVSGSCRDLMEFIQKNENTSMNIDTVEYDPNAIAYARKLFDAANVPTDKVNFIQENIYKFKPTKSYDVIWSSGLFDYLNNQAFVLTLQKLLICLSPGGELVVGNFHPSNPSRDYMEFGLWMLNHRTEQDLRAMAKAAGIEESKMRIESEKEGVNLFLVIQK